MTRSLLVCKSDPITWANICLGRSLHSYRNEEITDCTAADASSGTDLHRWTQRASSTLQVNISNLSTSWNCGGSTTRHFYGFISWTLLLFFIRNVFFFKLWLWRVLGLWKEVEKEKTADLQSNARGDHPPPPSTHLTPCLFKMKLCNHMFACCLTSLPLKSSNSNERVETRSFNPAKKHYCVAFWEITAYYRHNPCACHFWHHFVLPNKQKKATLTEKLEKNKYLLCSSLSFPPSDGDSHRFRRDHNYFWDEQVLLPLTFTRSNKVQQDDVVPRRAKTKRKQKNKRSWTRNEPPRVPWISASVEWEVVNSTRSAGLWSALWKPSCCACVLRTPRSLDFQLIFSSSLWSLGDNTTLTPPCSVHQWTQKLFLDSRYNRAPWK